MGSIKRETVNVTLLDSDYSNLKTIIALLRNWHNLENLSSRGDSVALSILMDFKTVMGDYNRSDSPLTYHQDYCIWYNLVEGYSQEEIAEELNVSQRQVSTYINSGLKRIQKYLRGELNGTGPRDGISQNP